MSSLVFRSCDIGKISVYEKTVIGNKKRKITWISKKYLRKYPSR